MQDRITRYKGGDSEAEDILIEDIFKLHNYNIDRNEAIVLLHKKYGNNEVF